MEVELRNVRGGVGRRELAKEETMMRLENNFCENWIEIEKGF